MSQVTIENILVGFGDLYIADVDTVLPTWATGSASLRDDFDNDANWTYLGATQEGVEIQYQPDYGEVEVDQLKDAARLFHQKTMITANTNLAESTLENLLVAWGNEDSFLSVADPVDTFSIGVQDEDPVERALAVVGKGGPANDDTRRERVYHARRVISIEGSTLALRRTEATIFPVQFRLLPDPDFPGAEYGVIIDRIPGTA